MPECLLVCGLGNWCVPFLAPCVCVCVCVCVSAYPHPAHPRPRIAGSMAPLLEGLRAAVITDAVLCAAGLGGLLWLLWPSRAAEALAEAAQGSAQGGGLEEVAQAAPPPQPARTEDKAPLLQN